MLLKLEHNLDVASPGVTAIDFSEVSVEVVRVNVEGLDVVGVV